MLKKYYNVVFTSINKQTKNNLDYQNVVILQLIEI